MIEFGTHRAKTSVDCIIVDQQFLPIEPFRTKRQTSAIVVSVRRNRRSEQPLVLLRAQMRRHRPARRRKFEPVIRLASAAKIISGAPLSRFGQVTDRKSVVEGESVDLG